MAEMAEMQAKYGGAARVLRPAAAAAATAGAAASASSAAAPRPEIGAETRLDRGAESVSEQEDLAAARSSATEGSAPRNESESGAQSAASERCAWVKAERGEWSCGEWSCEVRQSGLCLSLRSRLA